MSFYGKVYTFQKHENYDVWLKSIAVTFLHSVDPQCASAVYPIAGEEATVYLRVATQTSVNMSIPEDKVAAIMAEKSSEKIVKNGDKYTLTEITSKGKKDITFKPGVEFEDIYEEDNIPYKSTITVDGNTITQLITSSYGVATFKREYSGDDLVIHIFSDEYDGVAKMYYKA